MLRIVKVSKCTRKIREQYPILNRLKNSLNNLYFPVGTTIFINEALSQQGSNTNHQFSSNSQHMAPRASNGCIKTCVKRRRSSDPTVTKTGANITENVCCHPPAGHTTGQTHSGHTTGLTHSGPLHAGPAHAGPMLRRHSDDPRANQQGRQGRQQQTRSKSLGSHVISTHKPGVANCSCPMCDQRPFFTQ